jgi:hypothetical protein
MDVREAVDEFLDTELKDSSSSFLQSLDILIVARFYQR